MHITTVLPYSDLCTVLMLSGHMRGISALCMYITVASPYRPGLDITWWYQSQSFYL